MRRPFCLQLARRAAGVCLIAVAAFLFHPVLRAQNQIVWSDREKPILQQLRHLRELSDAERSTTTKKLAIQIRQLPVAGNKEALAFQLAMLATEGDPGSGTLQEVATTLAQALREQPFKGNEGKPPEPYIVLAQLVRYEHVQASLDDSHFADAMANLEADDQQRQQADFTLADLEGKQWTLKSLTGKVVLVNFWATWCPPCRKEMPDLEAIYQRFKERGLVILAISDEEASKVKPFIEEHKFSYPILLDPGRKVNEAFRVFGIPKSFLYDRNGGLVAQAIDMRTQRQFLEMLGNAGL
ncbi:MAG TPA: TlpA disulfide reductase family protein [Bryobacteraceae bacterium]|nr:TlpA disulfide reductase family protein [Bryobacteraceae bacterium]